MGGRRRSIGRLGATLVGVVLTALVPASVLAQDFAVTKTSDSADGTCDADCSLREAIIAANAAVGTDRILLGAGTHVLSLAGAGEDAAATGDLDVTADRLVVLGQGPASTAVDGGAIDRVFDVLGAGRLAVHGVAVGNGQITGDGGGIQTLGALELREARVAGNVATGVGGGIYLGAGSLEIVDSVVSGNTANGGAAGIRTFTNTTSTLTRVDVTGNTVPGFQGTGGIENGGTMTLVDVAVTGNTAGSSVGGVRNNSGALTIERSTISGNRALGTDSGGLFFAAGTVALRNVTISGNSAATNGGGLRSQGSTVLTLDGVTIAGNTSGSGGALAFFGSVPALVRATIVGDNVGDQCQGSTVVSLGSNIAEGATCAAFTATGDRLGADPGLAPLALAGGRTQTHALLPGSPALDQGGAVCSTVDQRGIPRPLGAACDSGAFEAQPDLRTTLASAPAAVTAGEHVTIIVTVANAGVAAAGGSTLAIALVGGLEPIAATPSQGSCSAPTSCALGTIAPAAPATVTLRVRPITVGASLVTATVSTTADAAAGDNTGGLAVLANAPTPPPAGGSVRPGVLALPRLTGTARVGKALRCGGASFSDVTRTTIRWLRGAKALKRETKATYRLTKADRGRIVSCAVKATGPGGAVEVVSLGRLVR